jgi:hypothetical protein
MARRAAQLVPGRGGTGVRASAWRCAWSRRWGAAGGRFVVGLAESRSGARTGQGFSQLRSARSRDRQRRSRSAHETFRAVAGSPGPTALPEVNRMKALIGISQTQLY